MAYDAGTATVVLTGRIVREPFVGYGQLVAAARQEKEHEIILGAKSIPTGFDSFMRNVLGAKEATNTAATSIKTSMDSITSSTMRMQVAATRELKLFDDAIYRVQQKYVGLGESSKTAAGVVEKEAQRKAKAEEAAASRIRAAADSQIKSNEEVAASAREAAGMGGGGGRGYVNPVARGGAGGGAGGTTDPVKQAKETSAAWKEGVGTLATLGKWTTLGLLGVGGVALKVAADFQRQMELVHTQAGYSQREVDKLRKSVLDLAPAVGIGPTKLAEGLYHIASSGIPAAHAMNLLKIAAEGAKVGNDDMESVTNALVAVLRTAPKDIHGVREAMGVMTDIVGHGNLRMKDLTAAMTTGLLPAGKAVGLGLRDVGAALDVLTARGVPAQEGATRLRTVLGLIANPTDKAQKALNELGFTHDRLAQDFRSKGLIGALDDLQNSMNRVFGHKLDADQMKQALTNYAQQLIDSGASTNTVTKDVKLFHDQLEKTGSGAVASSALIAQAFGGARMGTTMQILMQNVDDVRKHFDTLNQAGAAQRFQKAWDVTQQDFSVQASKLWAGLQRLGVQLGDFLIPKVEALVRWLIKAGEWMGKHKTLAEALAIAFGTLLTGAIVAFFGKFIANMAKSTVSIGRFAAQIYKLPGAFQEVSAKLAEKIGVITDDLKGAEEQAIKTGDAMDNMGSGMAGGGVGVASDTIIGMINGIEGTEAPGSKLNPLAVLVMDPSGFGGFGRGTTAAEGGAVTATGDRVAGRAAGGASTVATNAAGEPVLVPATSQPEAMATTTAQRTLSSRLSITGARQAGATLATTIGNVGSRVLRGGLVGITGMMGAQFLESITGSKTVGGIATDTALGAAIGSAIAPGIGTAIGGALGGVGGMIVHLLGGRTPTHADQQTAHATGAASAGGAGTRDLAAAGPSLKQSLNDYAKMVGHLKEIRQGMQELKTQYPGDVAAQEKEIAKVQAIIKQMEKDAEAGGTALGASLEKGWNKWQWPDTNVMFSQLVKATKGLPPQFQDVAAESAVKFVHKLEEQGRLGKGAAQTFLGQIEDQFPDFVKFMHLQGGDSMDAFNKAAKAKDIAKKISDELAPLITPGDPRSFSNVAAAAAQAGNDMQKKWGAAFDQLRADTEVGSAKERAAALTAWTGMVDDAKKWMPIIPQLMKNMSATGKQELAANFADAANAVQTNMHKMGLTTQQGMELVNKLLSSELEALGVTLPKGVRLSTASLRGEINFLQQGARGTQNVAIGHRAGGGYIPGGEYGHGDVMTLVDPHGNPRARLAGDEAVFNRHQMPYVEAGLSMLGFDGAAGLWSAVNRPHGYNRGGTLPGFARGGTFAMPGGGTTQGYQFPFGSGLTWGRTDMGLDMAGSGPIATVGNALFTLVTPQGRNTGWPGAGSAPGTNNGQGAMIVYKLLSGPDAGKYIYTAENIDPLPGIHAGLHLPAGHAFARARGAYPFLEEGWASGPTGSPVAAPYYHEGMVTAAGSSFTDFVKGLARGVIAGGSGATWNNIKVPLWKGPGGAVGLIGQAALTQSATAADLMGRQLMSSGGGGYGALGMITNASLRGMDHIYPPNGGTQFSPSLVAKLAEWAGLPGWTFSEIAHGESDYEPGAVEPREASGAQGFGLWQITSPFNTDIINKWGGVAAMRNPLRNAKAARDIFSRQGISAWHGTRYLMDYNKHYTGPMFAGGGWLPSFAGGGRTGGRKPPKSPSYYSPPKPATHARQSTRKVQPLSTKVSAYLGSIGLGWVADAQNTLGQLDQQYSAQDQLFSLFSGGTGYTQDELDTLQWIREQEWGILMKEHQVLPGIQTSLTARVKRLTGSKGHGAYTSVHEVNVPGAPPPGPDIIHHQAVTESGTIGLQTEIDKDTAEITTLNDRLYKDIQKIGKQRHQLSSASLNLANKYAATVASLQDQVNAIYQQQVALSDKRSGLHDKARNLPTASTYTPTASQIVSGVLSGSNLSPSQATTIQRRNIENQVAYLLAHSHHLSVKSHNLVLAMRKALREKDAAARKLHRADFDEAWVLQLERWQVGNRVRQLQETIKKLKAKLKIEQGKLNIASSALSTVQTWISGSTQGTGTVDQSLGTIGYDMLSLWQQGAHLPVPGKTPVVNGKPVPKPTVGSIEKFMTNVLKLTIPPGLIQNAQASAAYAEFQAFQADQAALFATYGSNFVGAGQAPFASAAGLAAGTQYYGAAAGPSPGVGAMARGGYLGGTPGWKGGDTSIEINQHFGGGPSDPHTYSAGLMHELGAMV